MTDLERLGLLFPEFITQCRPVKGLLLGMGVRAGKYPSLVYKWAGHAECLPDSPGYLISVGDKKKFWREVGDKYVVWMDAHPALIGIVQIGDRRVSAFSYHGLLKAVRKQFYGVSNMNIDYMVFRTLRAMINDDYGVRTPVILYTPNTDPRDMKPKIAKPQPIEGDLVPPPYI